MKKVLKVALAISTLFKPLNIGGLMLSGSNDVI
jgi:hypothetical protein